MPDIVADAIGRTKPFLFVVGPLPPPMQGQAATTKMLVQRVAPHVRLKIANVSPGTNQGMRARLVKTLRVGRAILGLVRHALAHRNRSLYMAADGGYGILYNILVAAVARLFRYRIFLHHHSFAYVDHRTLPMAALARVLRPRGTHIVLCEAMAQGLRARYRSVAMAPIIELTSAAFVAVPNATHRPSGAELQIGFLSNLIVEKGLDTCIDLLRACRKEQLPVRLLLAGLSPDRRSSEIVKSAQSEFGAAVEYLGPLTEDQKAEFFANIDAFVFPTRYVNEAQPRAVLESLFFGVPVLTTARGCISTDMNGGCGLCVPKEENFVDHALPRLRTWCRDRAALAKSAIEARSRAKYLSGLGNRQLDGFVTALQSSAGEVPQPEDLHAKIDQAS